MNSQRRSGEKILNQRLRQIERIIRRVAYRRRLQEDEIDELRSRVLLKLVQGDFAILRQHRSEASFESYLTVVVQRILLDYRTEEWGRWRASNRARRLGPQAVDLDRRIHRDGLEPAEAIQDLLIRGCPLTQEELEKLVVALPSRLKRCRAGAAAEDLDRLPAIDATESRLEATERRRTGARLKEVLGQILSDLPKDDRTLLGLRFSRGWTVRRIADVHCQEARALYRRFDRILQQIRRELEKTGLCRNTVAFALDGPEFEFSLHMCPTFPLDEPVTQPVTLQCWKTNPSESSGTSSQLNVGPFIAR